MYDEPLRYLYDGDFPSDAIGYVAMGRNLLKQFNVNVYYSCDIGREYAGAIINWFCGGMLFDDETVEVFSVLLSAMLLAEPKRNPACFLPNLMLIDLIACSKNTQFGDKYNWGNSIQNPLLLFQEMPKYMPPKYKNVTFGRMTWSKLETNEKCELNSDEIEFLNAERKYNGTKNQKRILCSEYLIQLGGYAPMSHRYSYTELSEKRKNQMLTLSDKKSFVIICDWLEMYGCAQLIPKDDFCVYQKIATMDKRRAFLLKYLFPLIWDNMDLLLLRG
jgi:hypothetical protein